MSNLDHRKCDCVPTLGPPHCHACESITREPEPYPGTHCPERKNKETGE